MTELVFHSDFIEEILLGNKKITLRRHRQLAHNFAKGDLIYATAQEGDDDFKFLIRVTDCTRLYTLIQRPDSAPFHRMMLPDAIAQEDGFADTNDAYVKLKQFYPDLRRSDTVAVIRFEIASIDNRPIIIYRQVPTA